MKAAKFKTLKRKHQFHRVRDIVAYVRRLNMTPAKEVIPGDTGNCEHEWVLEGQTMSGNIFSCPKCHLTRFSG